MTQFDPFNPLRIPQNIYGAFGLATGRILYQAAQPHGLNMIFSGESRRITVLNTSTFEPAVLRNIIFSDATRYQYNHWYPELDEARDALGNLQIRLTHNRPADLVRRRLVFEPIEEERLEGAGAIGSLLDEVIRRLRDEMPAMQRAVEDRNITRMRELLFPIIEDSEELECKQQQIEQLLALKVPLTKEDAIALWHKYPDLAINAAGEHPHIANFCPFAVIHQLCSQADGGTLKIAVLVASGAQIAPEEFLLLCREFPEVMLQVVADNPKLAKNYPPFVLDQLYTLPDQEAMILKFIDLGAELRPLHLYLAIKNNFVSVAVKLISLKIDVSYAYSNDLKPPLIMAVIANYDFLVDLLIQARAVVTVQDSEGRSPLHFAAQSGNQAIVHMLIQAGARVLVKNSSGHTPRDLALQSGHTEIAKLLFDKSLPEAIQSHDKELVEELLLQNSPLSDETFLALCFEFPELAIGVLDRKYDYVKIFPTIELFNLVIHEKCEPLLVRLIELHENCRTARTDKMKTLLHCSLDHKRTQAAATLLDLGVDIFAQDDSGQTALHLAAKAGSQELVNKLLKAGADPFYADCNGCTALGLALDSNQLDTAKVLLRTSLGPFADKVTLQKCNQTINQLQTLAETTPELVRLSCTPTSTPFEIALLLGSHKLLVTFMRQLSEEQCIAGVEVLLAKYPSAHLKMVDFLFQVDEQHLAFGSLSRMDSGPPAIEPIDLGDIVARFKAVTATDSEQKILINGQIADAVNIFLKRVKNEEVFTGTPYQNTPAFKEQYRFVRDAITHVLVHLQKSEQKAGYDKKVVDVCKELAFAGYECFIQYRATALMLYNKYCLQIAPTAENAILQQLQQLRGILVEGMTSEKYVNQPQSVHAVQYFKRVLGGSLQLADRALFAQELPYDGSGFTMYERPSVERVTQSFFARYRPAVVFEYIQGALADERMRSLYLDWAKTHIKTNVPGREDYKAKKAALQQKQNEIIKKMLKAAESVTADDVAQYKSELQNLGSELAVEPQWNSTYVESAKADMAHLTRCWLLDEQTLAPKPLPIILMLIKQKVLKFREDV